MASFVWRALFSTLLRRLSTLEFFVMESTDINEWYAFRARGPIGFLYSCSLCIISFWPYYTFFNMSSNFALLEMFCRVGFEQRSPVLCYRKSKFNNFESMFLVSTTVFYALANIFKHSRIVVMMNGSIENGLTRLLHMSLEFPERNNLSGILNDLHDSRNHGDHGVAIAVLSFRVCRQLFALGLFRQPDYSAKVDPKLSWARRCLYDGELSLDSVCAICRKGHLINTKKSPLWYRSCANFSAAHSLCCNSRALRSGVWLACATSSAGSTRWSGSCHRSSFAIFHVQMKCLPKILMKRSYLMSFMSCKLFQQQCFCFNFLYYKYNCFINTLLIIKCLFE